MKIALENIFFLVLLKTQIVNTLDCEYPQSMFCRKDKEIYIYPCIPHFYYIKVGFKGVFIARTCFTDGKIFSYFCLKHRWWVNKHPQSMF